MIETKIVPLKKFMDTLAQSAQSDIYVEYKRDANKIIIPVELAGIFASRDGKFQTNTGLGVYPKGSIGFATVAVIAAGGVGATAVLGTTAGFNANNTTYQWRIVAMDIQHDEAGQNRKLIMYYGNASMQVYLIEYNVKLVAPVVPVPLYPRLEDSAGAVWDTGLPGQGIIVDKDNKLTVNLSDLTNGQTMIVSVAYMSIIHE